MKLGILSDIWHRLHYYWLRFANNHLFSKQLTPKDHLSLASKIKKKNVAFTSRPRKAGRVYRFNADQFSDSFDLSLPQVLTKKKLINKKSKQNKRANREVSDEQKKEAKRLEQIFGDLGSEISSIGEKDSEDSNTTIKQFISSIGQPVPIRRALASSSKNKFQLEKQIKASNMASSPNSISKRVVEQKNNGMKKKMIMQAPIFEASVECSRNETIRPHMRDRA